MVIGMADNRQELRKKQVRNSTELRTPEKRNNSATDSATEPQQDSVKARAFAILRRNRERNTIATPQELERNKLRNNQPKVASKVASVAEQRMQQRSSDWVRFCLAHENTYNDGHCPVRHDRVDPFTHCLGWQLKIKRKAVIH
jgi:hypothetical protein